mmetsp:Transcript_40271/g.121293  ORF Transcript_40271/g.121293 Transcript_40271/m.121293 type:complete len:150 (-) Transcript_40271:73-522(-)
MSRYGPGSRDNTSKASKRDKITYNSRCKQRVLPEKQSTKNKIKKPTMSRSRTDCRSVFYVPTFAGSSQYAVALGSNRAMLPLSLQPLRRMQITAAVKGVQPIDLRATSLSYFCLPGRPLTPAKQMIWETVNLEVGRKDNHRAFPLGSKP